MHAKKIWIDADACPNPVKELLFRAAVRTQTQLIAVANHFIQLPPSPYIKRHQVSAGFDAADQYILDNLQIDDLVITADIPLAEAVISLKAHALNPRGELYTTDNIKQYLTMRNFNESLRSCNMIRGGVDKLSQKEIREFANNLDRFLARK